MAKCEFDPKEIKGAIGMFHCPDCGEMVIAGVAHPPEDNDDESVFTWDDFIDEEAKDTYHPEEIIED